MSAERWARLAAALDAGGVDADVDASPYPGGVARSITLLQPGRGLVHIRDSWWRKNPDIWIGYTVTSEDADGIITRQWPLTKKRSEVVAAVVEAHPDIDTSSSASRQHYIDTGRYLVRGRYLVTQDGDAPQRG